MYNRFTGSILTGFNEREIMNAQKAVVFTHEKVDAYRAMVISGALRMYARTGMKVNRAYTPSAMLAAATSMTGVKYKRGEYLKAADDLKNLVEGGA